MKIVASNSLTISNINDGTITHTAYAYSADGTDGFTTIYPNLNLLEDGKFAKPISSNWYTDGTTISKDDITGYFKVKFNGTGSLNRTYYGGSISTIPIGQKYSVYIKAYSLESSLNIKMGSVNSSQAITVTNNSNVPKTYKVEGLVRGNSNTFGIFGGLTTTRGTLFISEIKLEPGSVTTQYMPSSSEVKTADWPSYIGQYTDFTQADSTNPSNYTWSLFKGQDSNAYTAYSWSSDGTDRFSTVYPNLNLSESQEQWQDAIPMYIGVGEKDSQKPSDYRWQLNPRYVQASSDSGLSNKAGLDDLASVADTANDALVQAQNAVSNEDYTSWLEHDYQTTINNLQDVSTQNKEDINNVNDRTIIVEGFYDRMKVKWNFINEAFTFSEEGMFISNEQSKMAIQVTSDKIVFWDNNVDVAFITGEVLNIQKGVFLESATIGNHLITKFSNESPVTIIRYVGGIT